MPRPLGQQELAERVGLLLHFDFLYIGESAFGHEYTLILKDYFSGYAFYRRFLNDYSNTGAFVFIEIFITIVPVLKSYSSQGLDFCNELMELLATTLGVLR